VNKELSQYSFEISKKDQVELREDQIKFLFINKKPAFFWHDQQWVPTLRFLQTQAILKTIIVDMGAIKFLIGGADVMRPGIVEINEAIAKDEVIAILDKNNRKPITVGIALYSGAEMKLLASGKVIKNIHYVGDKIWSVL